MQQRIVKTSKFLSYVLRHKPEAIGVTLDQNGWVETGVLLEACRLHNHPLTREELEEVVRSNDKQRFAFSEDGSKIRASQGHSIEIELDYWVIEPPELLYHGTATRYLASIQEQGLVKGKRHHVHLSGDVETARKVGMRHGKPVVFQIAAGEMRRNGFVFYLSANGVWLTDHVPTRYIQEA
jgi:putative RNA 2'-phosphotransferase